MNASFCNQPQPKRPGHHMFADRVVRIDGIPASKPSIEPMFSVYAILFGAAGFLNHYSDVRKAPNCILVCNPAIGPNHGLLTLQACTRNRVGIASRQELVIDYGSMFDVAHRHHENIDISDSPSTKRFKGALDDIFSRQKGLQAETPPPLSEAHATLWGEALSETKTESKKKTVKEDADHKTAMPAGNAEQKMEACPEVRQASTLGQAHADSAGALSSLVIDPPGQTPKHEQPTPPQVPTKPKKELEDGDHITASVYPTLRLISKIASPNCSLLMDTERGFYLGSHEETNKYIKRSTTLHRWTGKGYKVGDATTADASGFFWKPTPGSMPWKKSGKHRLSLTLTEFNARQYTL